MDVIEAYHLLKTAYPTLSRQQGRAILRALVQQVGQIDRACEEITRLIPDPDTANKMIQSIRNEFAHKRVLAVKASGERPGV